MTRKTITINPCIHHINHDLIMFHWLHLLENTIKMNTKFTTYDQRVRKSLTMYDKEMKSQNKHNIASSHLFIKPCQNDKHPTKEYAISSQF